MAHCKSLRGLQALPLPFGDRSIDHLEIDGSLQVAGSAADRHFLLCEARRVLRAGGALTALTSHENELATLERLARQVGFDAVEPTPPVGDANPTPPCHFRKPDRTVSDRPLVSVLLPAYSPRYFAQSLASAVEQTYANIEIIVCDDSDGNDIDSIVRRNDEIRPIRYFRNPTRLKARANYAKCFALANGEFIKYLNDDDLLAPDCVERMITAFRLVPDLVLATSYRRRIDCDGHPLPDQPATRPLIGGDSVVAGLSLANHMILAGLNVVGEPTTVMFRKADLARIMPHSFRFENDDNIGIIDMMMWMSLLLQGDAVYLRDGLSCFRIHNEQQQQEPWIVQPTIANIRRMQAFWMSLHLHHWLPAGGILAKPCSNIAGPWQVCSVAPAMPVLWPRLCRFC